MKRKPIANTIIFAIALIFLFIEISMAMPIFDVAHDTVEGESALALIVVIMIAFGPMLVAGFVTLILGIVLLCISKRYNDKFSAALKFVAPFLIGAAVIVSVGTYILLLL